MRNSGRDRLQLLDSISECGAEQQGLSLLGQFSEYCAQIRLKTGLQETICFVQNLIV